jgi:hypothetical protein
MTTDLVERGFAAGRSPGAWPAVIVVAQSSAQSSPYRISSPCFETGFDARDPSQPSSTGALQSSSRDPHSVPGAGDCINALQG